MSSSKLFVMMGHPESVERSHPRYTTTLIDERMTIPSRTDKLDWAWRTGVADHLHTFNGHLPSLDLRSKEELDVRHHWPAAIDLQQRPNRNADFGRCQTQDIFDRLPPFLVGQLRAAPENRIWWGDQRFLEEKKLDSGNNFNQDSYPIISEK